MSPRTLCIAAVIFCAPLAALADEWTLTTVDGTIFRFEQLDSVSAASVFAVVGKRARAIPLDSITAFQWRETGPSETGAVLGAAVGIGIAVVGALESSGSYQELALTAGIPLFGLLGMVSGGVIGSIVSDREAVAFAPTTTADEKRRAIARHLTG